MVLVIVLILLLVSTPFIVSGIGQWQHKGRQRLVDSRRRIHIADAQREAKQGGCGHKRSRSRAQPGPRGKLVSVCKWCGAPMERRRQGDWVEIEETGAAEAAP
jgi:hypothetical protein